LIKDKEPFFQSFLCVLPAGKTQRKNPLFCHWSLQGKTKEKQGLFPWFFHSFSLEKLNAFCSGSNKVKSHHVADQVEHALFWSVMQPPEPIS
jgi:hypothetical protein